MILATYQLCCDVDDCTVAHPNSFTANTVAKIRAEAAACGWVVNRHCRDYCPGQHAEQAPPEYKRPRGICIVCGAEKSITPTGVIMSHELPKPPGRRWGDICSGSRCAPAKVVTP